MKKLLATLLLLMCVSLAFAGKAGDSAVENPNAPVCHDKNGKWDPQSKSCEPGNCGCLFHQIEEFFAELFD